MDATAGVFVCYKKRLLKRLSYREGNTKTVNGMPGIQLTVF